MHLFGLSFILLLSKLSYGPRFKYLTVPRLRWPMWCDLYHWGSLCFDLQKKFSCEKLGDAYSSILLPQFS